LIEDYSLDRGYVVCHTDLYKERSFDRWDGITAHILANMHIRADNREINGFPKILEYLKNNKQLKRNEYRKIKLSHPCFQNAIEYTSDGNRLDARARGYLVRYLLGERMLVKNLKNAGL